MGVCLGTRAAAVGCGVLEVVVSGHSEIEVSLALAATIGPRRASVLLHDDSSPARVDG